MTDTATPPALPPALTDADRRKKVDMKQLPRGGGFVEHSLDETVKMSAKARKDPEVVEWARQRNVAAGSPKSMKGRAEALLAAFHGEFGYVEDPYDAEFIAKPRDVMCLPGHDYCFRAADCEELSAALASTFGAVGLQTAIIHQKFPETNHAIVGVFTEDGWKRADPSYFGELGRHYIAGWERWIDTMTGTTLHTGDGHTEPDGPVSDFVFLGRKPLHDFVAINGAARDALQALGAGPVGAEQVIAAWGAWLDAANRGMKDAFARAKSSIDALGAMRDTLGKAQYDAEGSDGWTSSVAALFYGKVTTSVTDLSRYADEALAGKRGVLWSTTDNGGSLAIAALPGDVTQYSPGQTADSITATALAPTPPGPGGEGTLGVPDALGVAPLVVLGVAASVAVTAVSVYLVVSKICDAYQAHVAAVAQRDLAQATDGMIKNGATPEQAQKIVEAIGKSAPTTAGQPPKEDPLAAMLGKLVTGIVVVAVAGLALVVVERIVEHKALQPKAA